MLGNHINLNLKRGVKIITCDPSTRTIEAETRNGEVISINAYYYTPVFRWPVSGEKWIVREENGSWFLEGIYESQNLIEEVKPEPGDIVLSVGSGRILINEEGRLHELLGSVFPRLLPTPTATFQFKGTLQTRFIP